MTRRLLRKLLARLDASPLPMTDPVRLELEWEILKLLERVPPPAPTVIYRDASEHVPFVVLIERGQPN